MAENRMDSVDMLLKQTVSFNDVMFYRNIFNKYDKNKDGYISISELKKMIEDEHYDNDIPDMVLVAIYKKSDKNHDQKLDFGEFVEMISNPNYKHIFESIGNQYVQLVVPRRLDRTLTRTGMYEDQCFCKPSTISMILISVLELTMFYIDQSLPKVGDPFSSDPLENEHASALTHWLMFDPRQRQQIWRYFTYMFIHASQSHVWFNVIIQIAFGIPLEMVHGWRVLIIYFAGVFGGSLISSALTDHPIVGASAGVYAFFTAHIATVIMNWREMTCPAAQLFLFLILTVSDLTYALLDTANENHVSYESHAAGAVCGLLVGVNILRNLRVTKTENVIWWISIVIYAILMSAAIIKNIIDANC